MNIILCPSCYLAAGSPEEKSCTHGTGVATCNNCDAKRVPFEEEPWHCLGTCICLRCQHAIPEQEAVIKRAICEQLDRDYDGAPVVCFDCLLSLRRKDLVL